MAQPIIRGGVFSAHDALGLYERKGRNLQAAETGQHYQHDNKPGNNKGGNGKARVEEQADPTYPLGKYWANVEAMGRVSASGPCRDEDGDAIMDAQFDAHGVRLPTPAAGPGGPGKTANIRTLFDRERRAAECDFSPMGLTLADGAQFQLVFPPGEVGQKLIKLLTDLSFLIVPGTIRFNSRIEQQVVASLILPCPLHISPLALVLSRSRDPCLRFTDAISSACRLRVIRDIILDLDIAQPEHKKMCVRFYDILAGYVSTAYYKKVNLMLERLDECVKDNESRLTVENATTLNTTLRTEAALVFAKVSDEFSLAYVHGLEWTICDLLRVPYHLRHLLMTPNMTPAGRGMASTAFAVLRSNLANYVRDRNLFFCAIYDKEAKRYTGMRPDAWHPMNLDTPVRIEDRLARTSPSEVYNDWIDRQSLIEYALFISNDTRPEAMEAARLEKERTKVRTEEEELVFLEEATMGMDIGKDE